MKAAKPKPKPPRRTLYRDAARAAELRPLAAAIRIAKAAGVEYVPMYQGQLERAWARVVERVKGGKRMDGLEKDRGILEGFLDG